MTTALRLVRTALLIGGGAVLIVAGIAMLVLPGPGWLTIALGLSLWARRFGWAYRLQQSVLRRVRRVVHRKEQS